MWFYAFYAAAFLYLTNAILEKHYNAHEEAIFADVIRNISRVNNVLQELISNYEQLQKIYKSQEEADEYSTDTEIDEVFKSMQKAKKKYKRGPKTDATEKPVNAEYFPATQMIWSDDNDDGDTVEDVPKSAGVQAKQNPPKDDVIDNSSSKSTEVNKNTSFLKPKEANIVFVDTHKKLEEINVNNDLPFNAKNATKKPKTRYKKVSKNDKANMKAGKNKSNNTLTQNGDTKSIKKIIYAETFSPKSIWKEIIKNKPVQLKTQKEITYDEPQKRAVSKPKESSGSDTGKAALVIVTKNNQKGVNTEKDTLESPEDGLIAKELFKTNVLRQAYGDACMKVVIKKCFKACKLASKSYCSVYKCKNVFKSKFKELSKTGCIKEYTRPKNKTSDVHYRGQDVSDSFTDATRGRFLDAACIPHLGPKHKRLVQRNDTPAFNRSIRTHDKSINILRDKYERACKKISAQKCATACNYAATKTCDTFNCDRTKRRKFKKNCKEQCDRIYNIYSDSEYSDTDSSSDSSDSDTDSSAS